MKRLLLVLIPPACFALLLFGVLRMLDAERQRGPDEAGVLLLHCDSAMLTAVAGDSRDDYGGGAIDAFRRRTGLRVSVNHGVSDMLLKELLLTRQGDLFMSGDESHIEAARYAGLVYEVRIIDITPPVSIAVLTTSRNRDAALRFADFLAGPAGRPFFAGINIVLAIPPWRGHNSD